MPVNRRHVLATAGVGATSALAGCLGDDDPSANLWHGLGTAATNALDEQVAGFIDETGRSIDAQAVDDLEEQLESTIPMDEGPELFGWTHDWLGNFEQRNFVTDASEELTVDLDELFLDQAAAAPRYEGGVYGLPYAAETVTLLYNQELVDEPPETVDELVEAADAVHDPDENTYGLVAPIDPYTISGWLHAGDGFYHDPDTDTIGVDDPATVEALAYYRDTLWPYQPDSADYDDQVEPFHDGNAAFAIVGPVEYEFEEDGDGITNEAVGATQLPTADIGQPSPYVSVQLWYFSRLIDGVDDGGLLDWLLGSNGNDSEAGEIAVEFAEWHTTNEGFATRNAADDILFLPVLSAVAEEVDEDPVAAYLDSLRAGQPIPKAPAMRVVWEPLADAIEAVLVDDDDPASALADARSQIDDEREELP